MPDMKSKARISFEKEAVAALASAQLNLIVFLHRLFFLLFLFTSRLLFAFPLLLDFLRLVTFTIYSGSCSLDITAMQNSIPIPAISPYDPLQADPFGLILTPTPHLFQQFRPSSLCLPRLAIKSMAGILPPILKDAMEGPGVPLTGDQASNTVTAKAENGVKIQPSSGLVKKYVLVLHPRSSRRHSNAWQPNTMRVVRASLARR